ncbi:hypothetical protein [Actinoallomurus soli]|uniref:hypothetical protein n=1 Tax=Actinoallomurus soli TaxID=2952535 RepID=UPI002093C37A|nr:hypothetical protein [Actinoallomurus soli]MCO5967032.1 hypothetical protein [Actinoallomurus soli]
MNTRSSPLPSTADLTGMSPAQMERVLARSDLADAPAEWWTVLLSVCNTGLLGTESGSPDGRTWGAILLTALDVARRAGALEPEQALQRRLMVQAAMLHYFGPSKQDPVLDPELMVTGFLDDIGRSRDEVREESRELEHELRVRRGDPALLPRAFRMRRVKDALGSLRLIAGHLTDEGLRREAEEWWSLADRIP